MDKRQFQRIKIKLAGKLSLHEESISVTIEDISLQGLRLSATESELSRLPFDSHDPYQISFRANPDSPDIMVHIQQLYRQSPISTESVFIGCKVDHIDVESLAELRRLINLNSGNDTLSNRDLDALIDAIYGNASNASES